MPRTRAIAIARRAALIAFCMHALALFWVAWRFAPGLRGGVIFWMDLPLSLAYAGLGGGGLVATSLVAGGLLWAAVAAALAALTGRLARTDR